MSPTLLRVSPGPTGWSVCRMVGRRRPVAAWSVIAEDGGPTTVGMIARGVALVRGDRWPGFVGYAAGPGCEPQLEPPALPPADLDAVMDAALADHAGSVEEFEARIRSALTVAAAAEFATVSLAGFEENPGRWFRLWLRGRREHEATEADLWRRLRALTLMAPGRSLQEALLAAGVSLGAMLAAPNPESTGARGGAEEKHPK